MKNELRIFFTALMFYTRIPCPKWVDHDPAFINKATRYFPFIGYIVGSVSYILFFASAFLFSSMIAIVFSLIAGVLVTGAFHEDGFADVCDGFGGGWTKTKILEIMKDSRVGAYGVIGTILLLLLKFFALNQIILWLQKDNPSNVIYFILVFIAYHALARLTAITIVFTEAYAKEDEESKAKPIAQAYSYKEVLGAFVFGLAPLFALSYFLNWYMMLTLLPLIILRFFMIRYFNKWIQGYTGDCLGAVEQIAEVVVMLSILGISKFAV